MKPRELFGVAVRVIGLVNLIYMLASALLLFGSPARQAFGADPVRTRIGLMKGRT